MKRVPALILAAVLILGVGSMAGATSTTTRDRICRELWRLGLVQYDRAYAAREDIETGHYARAHTRLINIDATWVRFDTLGRQCGRIG